MSRRTEMSWKAEIPEASLPHKMKPTGLGDTVNGTAVQGQFTVLSGEICSKGGFETKGV